MKKKKSNHEVSSCQTIGRAPVWDSPGERFQNKEKPSDTRNYRQAYSSQLEDPRWQRKRLEIMHRDQFSCQLCGSETNTLHVHHRYYISGRKPWEYPGFCYQTLCKKCHFSLKDRDLSGAMFSEWEVGLNYFGESIFEMAESEMLRSK